MWYHVYGCISRLIHAYIYIYGILWNFCRFFGGWRGLSTNSSSAKDSSEKGVTCNFGLCCFCNIIINELLACLMWDMWNLCILYGTWCGHCLFICQKRIFSKSRFSFHSQMLEKQEKRTVSLLDVIRICGQEAVKLARQQRNNITPLGTQSCANCQVQY